MSDVDSYAREVGNRLRKTAIEFGYPTAREFGEAIGATRGAVDAWFNGRALPPISYMRLLADWGITLEWVYNGKYVGMDKGLSIRLHAIMSGITPPDSQPEPDPMSEGPSPWESQGAVSPRRRSSAQGKQRKRANAV